MLADHFLGFRERTVGDADLAFGERTQALASAPPNLPSASSFPFLADSAAIPELRELLLNVGREVSYLGQGDPRTHDAQAGNLTEERTDGSSSTAKAMGATTMKYSRLLLAA